MNKTLDIFLYEFTKYLAMVVFTAITFEIWEFDVASISFLRYIAGYTVLLVGILITLGHKK